MVETNRDISNFKIRQESALSVLPQACECSSTVRSENALKVALPACSCLHFPLYGQESSESPNCLSLCSELGGDPTALQVVLLAALGFCASGEVDCGLVLFITVNVLEVDHHVQGVSKDKQQDQRRDEAHEDGRGEERGTVAGRGELVRVDVECLNLLGRKQVGMRRYCISIPTLKSNS